MISIKRIIGLHYKVGMGYDKSILTHCRGWRRGMLSRGQGLLVTNNINNSRHFIKRNKYTIPFHATGMGRTNIAVSHTAGRKGDHEH